jgi:hypothetical protein
MVCVALVAWCNAPALANETLKAKLIGFNETPAVSTDANGEFRAKISEDESSIEFTLSYEGLEGPVRQGHIHFGQKGVAGGISIWLCETAAFQDPANLAETCPQEGTITGSLTAANVVGPAGQGIAVTEFAEVLSAIRAGVTYANIHSDKFPSGEIRGQIKASKGKHRD